MVAVQLHTPAVEIEETVKEHHNHVSCVVSSYAVYIEEIKLLMSLLSHSYCYTHYSVHGEWVRHPIHSVLPWIFVRSMRLVGGARVKLHKTVNISALMES